MLKLYSKFQALWATRDQGASAVEYGLLVAGIAVAIVAIVFVLGGKLHDKFQSVCDTVARDGAATGAGC